MDEIIIATCSLEIGKAADVNTVLVDGRMVLHGGRATSADESGIVAHAEAAATTIFDHSCFVPVESDTARLAMTQNTTQRAHALRGLVGGIVGTLATIGVALFLPKPMALEFLSIVLGGIAFVYFGFVLMDGRVREMLFEFGNITLTLTFAFLGLWIAPYWLAAGYFIHGIWDAIHHLGGVQTKIPRWYIPFCLLYDWLVAGFIIIWWR